MSRHEALTDANQRLEVTVRKMAALLEIHINLHHYLSQHGTPLSDSAVAGLLDITDELRAEAEDVVEAVFAKSRAQKEMGEN